MFDKIVLLVFILFLPALNAQNEFETDKIKTSEGDLVITFIGHGSLMFTFNKTVIHADPFSKLADYSELPDADIILVTPHHGDHFDPEAIKEIRNENTTVILTELCAEKFEGGTVMGNGDIQTVEEIKIEAVPAYNLINMRDNGEPYHIKGTCNGYIITFGDKRVYVAGDTENTPEMKALEDIDIAFLPMNLPYTMTPEMVADAAKAFKPEILYPYHFGETDVSEFTSLMKDEKDVEIRLRKMK